MVTLPLAIFIYHPSDIYSNRWLNRSGIFVNGTPTWGGIGTVIGGAIGAAIITFIEIAVIAARLTGFYRQFFYGLIIIISLIGHHFNDAGAR